ncbi:MAG TPA: hypothetical protein DGG95_13620 [Cytophagales bacterium]|jgi:hypothetical protein|nr:hypothetical protein [Cytophagales bacterium]
MNYCTANEVKLFLGSAVTFSDTAPISKPTLTEVNALIADITNDIDLQLSVIGINTQPTDFRILSRLKRLCLYGCAGHIGIQFNSTSNPNPEMSRTNYYLSQYEKLLKEITDNPEVYGVISGSDDYCNVSSNVLDGSRTEDEITSNFVDRDFKL